MGSDNNASCRVCVLFVSAVMSKYISLLDKETVSLSEERISTCGVSSNGNVKV